MSTDFSPDVTQLIQQEFSYGRYATQEELLTEAVKLLGQRDRLREQVDAGVKQLDAAQYTDYDSASLRQRFEELKAGKTFSARRK